MARSGSAAWRPHHFKPFQAAELMAVVESVAGLVRRATPPGEASDAAA
ncbi:MAG: hypothetical protein ABL977_16700 [Candidatus Eisenbacteria bacterium]